MVYLMYKITLVGPVLMRRIHGIVLDLLCRCQR